MNILQNIYYIGLKSIFLRELMKNCHIWLVIRIHMRSAQQLFLTTSTIQVVPRVSCNRLVSFGSFGWWQLCWTTNSPYFCTRSCRLRTSIVEYWILETKRAWIRALVSLNRSSIYFFSQLCLEFLNLYP